MATNTKTITTRIKNKIDSYANWKDSTGKLLNGEIAVVRVTTEEVTPTGEVVHKPALLMKVGDGETQFAELPWLSAKASDVYAWAKNSTATDVPVTVNNTNSTLGTYLAKVDTNTTSIAALTGKVDTTGSVANAIKTAIEALDSNTTGSGDFVRAVTQTDGVVYVTKCNITEDDLPSISADKIKVDANTTLASKIGTIDAAIAANTDLISAKIGALDGKSSGSSGAGKYVSSVTQTDGVVTTTYASFPTANNSTAGITKLDVTGGAATYDSIFGTDGLSSKVTKNTADITTLTNSIKGGVHFIGTVGAKPTSASVTVNGSTTQTAVAGDIVLWANEGIEYIYTGSKWEELGDVTRLGDLETKVDNLNTTATNTVSTSHKFVSQVTQSKGQISVTYTQPTSADVSHSSSTVSATLNNLSANKANAADVYTKTETNTKISDAINALAVSAPSASGNTTSFIDSVSQTNGKISATKKTIPDATTTTKGIVQLSSALDSTSEAMAATSNAVKSAYEAGVNAQSRVGSIEANYIKFNGDKLYVGKDGTLEIIFDCGGAPTA